MITAYTFDDILLVPKYSEIEREEVDIRSYFEWYSLNVPILSSPMDTITESYMMDEIYKAGGLGFHHRYCSMDKLKEAALFYGGIAVSPSMGVSNILALFKGLTQYPLLILDVAHGHTKKNLDFCKELIKNGCVVISGNVVTPSAAEAYVEAGVWIVRVGLGSGSICSTRTVTGVGVPQASAIQWIREEFPNIKIISDGGHKNTGHIVKALALGADYVMLGGMLAGCREVPDMGKTVYRGMASEEALTDFGKTEFIPEGVSKPIQPKRTNVSDVLKEIERAIKLACYYVGAKTLVDLRKCEKILITENAYREGLTK